MDNDDEDKTAKIIIIIKSRFQYTFSPITSYEEGG